jgi:hypothetical protein
MTTYSRPDAELEDAPLTIQAEKIAAPETIINKLLELKLEMNSKRTKFNWDHLNNFYNN